MSKLSSNNELNEPYQILMKYPQIEGGAEEWVIIELQGMRDFLIETTWKIFAANSNKENLSQKRKIGTNKILVNLK